jgi:homoserine kinase
MGISGSGPTVFALSKGEEKVQSIIDAAQQVYDSIGLGVDAHHSAINIRGAFVLA